MEGVRIADSSHLTPDNIAGPVISSSSWQHDYWLLSPEIREAMTLYCPIRSCQRSASKPWGEEWLSVERLVSEYCRAESGPDPLFGIHAFFSVPAQA